MTGRDLFRLDDRVALVTGASSGLGVQFARALDGAGASLVLAARRAHALEALAEELHDAIAVPTDVTDSIALDRLVATTVERYGRIDVLVNNAGVIDHVRVLEQDDDDFAEIIDVNLSSVYRLTKRVATCMVERGSGSIINVASILGLVVAPSLPQAGYAASKGGLINLTRELAVQWARRGVRVNALAPGWFPSEMTANLFDHEGGEAWIQRQTPLARAGRDGELDGPLLLLASDASSFMTGHVLVVDGGWTAI